MAYTPCQATFIFMKLIQKIERDIKKYSIELANLKENKAREFDKLSEAEFANYENQILLTCRIIKDLKQILELASLNVA